MGNILLIAIPGYGQNASVYNEWITHTENIFTTYAIDLPFHGKTEWSQPTFSPNDLIQIIQFIRKLHPDKPLNIAAYSLGARLLLASLPMLDFPCKRLFLIAPDGLHTPALSLLTNFSCLLKPIAMKLLKNTLVAKKILQFLLSMHLINRRNFLFIHRQLLFPHRINRLSFWTNTLTAFSLNTRKIPTLLQKKFKKICIIAGKQDDVIPLQYLSNLHKNLPKSNLSIINTNHQLLEFGIGEEIKNLVKKT